MRARLLQLLDDLQTGFWFVPSVMLLLSAALAFGLLSLDGRYDPGLKSSISWAYSGGPEGARSLLSTIAGSMITAASVTFSLASVALSIASQQYSSRVLRNFMRDRVTQVLLGTFVSTFLYCVLVVRVIRGSDFSGGFVPSIAITVAIALSLISLLMLVFFVHHVSSSIQASHIIGTVARDLQQAIPRLYPGQVASPVPAGSASFEEGVGTAVTLDRGGYLKSVAAEDLFDFAAKHDGFVQVLLKPGDFVVPGTAVARVQPDLSSDKDRKTICQAFLVGAARTPTQDIRYQFQQLTDVIVRALSPGINDPFTAMNGIDELGTGLALLARRPRPAELRAGADGKPRLFVPRPHLDELLRETVGHIAVFSSSDPFVVDHLLQALATVAPDLHPGPEQDMLVALRSELQRMRSGKDGSM